MSYWDPPPSFPTVNSIMLKAEDESGFRELSFKLSNGATAFCVVTNEVFREAIMDVLEKAKTVKDKNIEIRLVPHIIEGGQPRLTNGETISSRTTGETSSMTNRFPRLAKPDPS